MSRRRPRPPPRGPPRPHSQAPVHQPPQANPRYPPAQPNAYTGAYHPTPGTGYNPTPAPHQPPAYTRPGSSRMPSATARQPTYPSTQQPAYPARSPYGGPGTQAYQTPSAFTPTAAPAEPPPFTPPPVLLPPCKTLDTHPKTLAWCPADTGKHLLVVGSNQKDLNEQFQSTISIEIIDTRLSNKGNVLPVKGSLQYETCFSKLAWGKHESLPKGLVVGGMENGWLTFWDPEKLACSDKSALLCVADEGHASRVTDVHFNPRTLQYLASGSNDGKVYVWTVNDLENVKPQEVLGGNNQPIKAVRWNNTAPYILAAGDVQGQIFILDLRRNPHLLMTIQSPSGGIPKSLAWHPTIAMELAACWTSGDAELWDLANAMTPKATFQGDTRSEFLCWCPHDQNLLAIAGSDGVCRLYHINRPQHMIHSFMLGEPNFIIEWNPHHPGMLAASSVSGKVSVRTVSYTGPSHVPAWMERAAGVQLGFGGKFVHFHQQNKDKPPYSSIELDSVVADPVILQRAQELKQSLMNIRQNGMPVADLINNKINTSVADERTVWEMMSLYFNAERQKAFSNYLGFTEQKVARAKITQPVKKPEPARETDPDTFFDSISQKNLLESVEDNDKPEEQKSPSTEKTEPNEMEVKIQKSLVIGDYDSAVNLALESGMFADALAFAHVAGRRGAGDGLWDIAQSAYFEAHKNKFISQTLKRVVYGDLNELVRSSDLRSWKETLAIILTYGQAEAPSLIRALCDRLVTEGHNTSAAVQACICAGDCNRLAGLLTNSGQDGNQPESLHNSVEKILIFASLPPLMRGNLGGYEDVMRGTFAAYVDMLTSNGALVEAQFILHCTIEILRGRGLNVGKEYQMMMSILNEALGVNRREEPSAHTGRGSQMQSRRNPTTRNTRDPRQPMRPNPAQRMPARPGPPAPHRPTPTPSQPPSHAGLRSGVPGQPHAPAPKPIPSRPPSRPMPSRPMPVPSRPARPPAAPSLQASASASAAASRVGDSPTRKNAGFFGQNPVKKAYRNLPPTSAGHQPGHTPQGVAASGVQQPQGMVPSPHGMAPSPHGMAPSPHGMAPSPHGRGPPHSAHRGSPHGYAPAPARPSRPQRMPPQRRPR